MSNDKTLPPNADPNTAAVDVSTDTSAQPLNEVLSTHPDEDVICTALEVTDAEGDIVSSDSQDEQPQPHDADTSHAPRPQRPMRGGYRPNFFGQAWAVFRRELNLYFLTPMSYLVWTVMLVAAGYLFVTTLKDGGPASMADTFSDLGFLLVFAVPLLTMRLVAEELRQGTLEVLLCEPMGESAIVLGKFLAAWVFVLVLLLPTLTYPVALHVMGNPDIGPVMAGYLGLGLLSMVFVAIGLWSSTATSNQIAAGTLSFAFLFILWLLGRATDSLSEGWINDVLAYLNAVARFDPFRSGIIDSRSLVYILSLTALYLFLSVRFLGLRRLR